MYERGITGIVIEEYSSLADVVKILRKYTKESMMDIRRHISNKEYVMSCDCIDEFEIRRIIKCVNELKKSKIIVKIFERDREIPLQLLKNWVKTCRGIAIETDAEVELEASDVDMEKMSEFQYLWNEEQENYVVLKDAYDYTIFNIKTKSILHIEDEDLNNQVAAMMILHGNRVVSGKREITKILRG